MILTCKKVEELEGRVNATLNLRTWNKRGGDTYLAVTMVTLERDVCEH